VIKFPPLFGFFGKKKKEPQLKKGGTVGNINNKKLKLCKNIRLS
jgi:hypothetical protein